MTNVRNLIVIAAVMAFFAADALAQRRPVRRTPAPPRVVTTQPVLNPAAEMKAGAEKIAIQIKNTTKFLYILGGVAKGIEEMDKDTRANRAAREANEANKQDLLQAIRNLRAGLAALEVEFRTKDPLKRHLIHIQGITDLSGQTEDLARSGRYVDSGKPLLEVVEKLSDTLVALR